MVPWFIYILSPLVGQAIHHVAQPAVDVEETERVCHWVGEGEVRQAEPKELFVSPVSKYGITCSKQVPPWNKLTENQMKS